MPLKRTKRTSSGVTPPSTAPATTGVSEDQQGKQQGPISSLTPNTPNTQSGGGGSSAVTKWAPLAQQYGKQYGIPPSLLLGLIEQESGGNPNAVSSAGACGLTQFIPSTARSYGVKCGSSQSAVQSQVEGAAKYLKELGAASNVGQALGNYYGDKNPNGSYSRSVQAKAKKYSSYDSGIALDQSAAASTDTSASAGLLDAAIDLSPIVQGFKALGAVLGAPFTAEFWEEAKWPIFKTLAGLGLITFGVVMMVKTALSSFGVDPLSVATGGVVKGGKRGIGKAVTQAATQ